MCVVMASTIRTASGMDRHDVFKKLLRDSSPRNPTYILSRVIADFKAQSVTELTVRKGEEIFILFEINEWAFATVFADSGRQGYVPLDYCDLITDFYEQESSTQSHTMSNQHQKGREPVWNTKQREQTYHRPKVEERGLYDELVYYESRHGQGYDNSKISGKYLYDSCSPPPPANAEGLLYEENTTPVKICRQTEEVTSILSRRQTQCCCCCDHHQWRSRSRQEGYHNVLHYLHESQLPDSQCDDSESGLGDSESILSSDLVPLLTKADLDLNDMSTQTSKSLENITDHVPKQSSRPESVPICPRKNGGHYQQRGKLSPDSSLSTSDMSPLPSIDSVISESVFTDSPGEEPSFEREDFATVKRRQQQIVTVSCSQEVISTLETPIHVNVSNGYEPKVTAQEQQGVQLVCSPISKSPIPHSPTSVTSSSTHTSPASQSPNSSTSCTSPAPSTIASTRIKNKLALPILESGKKPNRVELERLSIRIKEKLKPTREKLISSRAERKISDFQSSNSPNSDVELVAEDNSNDTGNIQSAAAPAMNIEKREVTLQSIQEQYMMLEEARILYNAIKKLDVITVDGDED